MVSFKKLASRNIEAHSPEVPKIVEAETRAADAELMVQEKAIDTRLPPVVESAEGKIGLSKLIDDDFPFDESQLEAIFGMKNQKHACMTGAAGTGKTTCLKKLVDELQHSLAMVDMSTYFKKEYVADDPEDAEYEAPEQFVPSICMCSFTGRASQMIKRNFPRDWHGNIMTIHRMLAYMPEYYEDFDDDGNLVNKMRFIPTYNETFKMPWDIVIIDEAGMLGIDLYNEVLAALKPGARLYMVGDINQLPPTHGKSVFGFAMAKWPSYELTHVHRQVGVNNSIVDNAWRVLKGQTPKSDDFKNDPNWKFAMLELPGDSNTASRYLRKWLETIHGKLYDPIRDTIITPINAFDQTSGYALGQDPLNRELALMFNKNTAENPRYIIDAGRDRKYFAVGDKVMATKNDHEAGITNGMTGIITGIARNEGYQGDKRRFDTIDRVNEYLGTVDEEEDFNFSLDDLSGMMEDEKEKKQREKQDRGPASHIVTVQFGEGDHKFELSFGTLAEVASLMTAYVVTCHKMQGGESPFVAIICHQAHKRMLNREWLYTAITRASQRCVVLYTKQGLANALNKQNIKGATLAQKVQSFQKLQENGLVGAAVRVRIPEPESLGRDMIPAKNILAQATDRIANELDRLEHATTEAPKPDYKEPLVRDRIIERVIIKETIIREKTPPPPPPPPAPVDGGELKAEEYQRDWDKRQQEKLASLDKLFAKARPAPALPAPPRLIPQFGAIRMALKLSIEQEKLLLPKPEPKPVESKPTPMKGGLKLKLGAKK